MPFLLSESVSSVVIAGAGGFGLEIYDYLQAEAERGGPVVAGFIDDGPGSSTPAGIPLPHLGGIDAFRADAGQVVVVAIGTARARQAVLSKLWDHGVRTPLYCHESALVSPSARIGSGALVCPFSVINRDAALADGVLVNVHCSVGHGASVGEYSVLSPYAAVNGDARVGALCFLGTRATIYPGIGIGDHCIVDSHTGVRTSEPDARMISSRGNYRVSELRLRDGRT